MKHGRVEKLLKIESDSEPVYADADNYIKIKIKYMMVAWLQIFRAKKCLKKSTMQVFINNNARFCYQSKEKVLSSNTLGRM